MLVVLAGLVLLVLVYAYIYTMRRRTPTPPVRVLAESVPEPSTVSGEIDAIAALDALLAELERTTVRIDGSDELDDGSVVELEQLAERLEAAAAALERVG